MNMVQVVLKHVIAKESTGATHTQGNVCIVDARKAGRAISVKASGFNLK